MAEDDTTKLIIYCLGLATIGFFLYLAYREYRQPPDIGSMHQSTNIQAVEQKLLNLEAKIDSLQKSLVVKAEPKTERKTVSLNQAPISREQQLKSAKDVFGML